MSDVTIIKQPLLADNLKPVGRCWKFAVFDASVKVSSDISGEVRCEPENSNVVVRKGICTDYECQFNTGYFLPWLRR